MKTRIWIPPPTWQVVCDLLCLSLQNWERPRVVGELKGLAVCQSSQKTMSCRFRGTLFQGNNVGSDSRHLLSPDPLTHVHTYARARVHTYTHKWKKQLLLYHKCGWIYFFFHITVSQGQLFFNINKSVTIFIILIYLVSVWGWALWATAHVWSEENLQESALPAVYQAGDPGLNSACEVWCTVLLPTAPSCRP